MLPDYRIHRGSLSIRPWNKCGRSSAISAVRNHRSCCCRRSFVVEPPFDSRRQTSVCCTDSSVSPIAHVVSPDHCFQLRDSVILGAITPAVKQFLFHPSPHTFTASVVVTSATVAVHALYYPAAIDQFAIFLTCVLAAPVRMDYAAFDAGIRFLGIIESLAAE